MDDAMADETPYWGTLPEEHLVNAQEVQEGTDQEDIGKEEGDDGPHADTVQQGATAAPNGSQQEVVHEQLVHSADSKEEATEATAHESEEGAVEPVKPTQEGDDQTDAQRDNTGIAATEQHSATGAPVSTQKELGALEGAQEAVGVHEQLAHSVDEAPSHESVRAVGPVETAREAAQEGDEQPGVCGDNVNECGDEGGRVQEPNVETQGMQTELREEGVHYEGSTRGHADTALIDEQRVQEQATRGEGEACHEGAVLSLPVSHAADAAQAPQPVQTGNGNIGRVIIANMYLLAETVLLGNYFNTLRRYRNMKHRCKQLVRVLLQNTMKVLLRKYYTKLSVLRATNTRMDLLVTVLAKRTKAALVRQRYEALRDYGKRRRRQKVISSTLHVINSNVVVMCAYRKWKMYLTEVHKGAMRQKLARNLEVKNDHIVLVRYYNKLRPRQQSRWETRRLHMVYELQRKNLQSTYKKYFWCLKRSCDKRRQAAIKIQAARRGQVTRKQLKEHKPSTEGRKKAKPRSTRHTKRTEAASKIQEFHRTTVVKVKKKEEEQALTGMVLRLQCLFRRMRAMKRVGEKRAVRPVAVTSLTVKAPREGPLKAVGGLYKTCAATADEGTVWVNERNVKLLVSNNVWVFKAGVGKRTLLKSRGTTAIRPLPTDVRTWLSNPPSWNTSVPVAVRSCFRLSALTLSRMAKGMASRKQLYKQRETFVALQRKMDAARRHVNIMLGKYWHRLYTYYKQRKEKRRRAARLKRRAEVPELRAKNERVVIRRNFGKFVRIGLGLVKARKQVETARDLCIKSVHVLGCRYLAKLVWKVLISRCRVLERRHVNALLGKSMDILQRYSYKQRTNREKVTALYQKNTCLTLRRYYALLGFWAPVNVLLRNEEQMRDVVRFGEGADTRRLRQRSMQLLRRWAANRQKVMAETAHQLFLANTMVLMQKAWRFLYNYTALKTLCKRRRAAAKLLKQQHKAEAALVPKTRALLKEALSLAQHIQASEEAERSTITTTELASIPPTAWADSQDFYSLLPWDMPESPTVHVFRHRVYPRDRFRLRPGSSGSCGVEGLFKKPHRGLKS